MQRFVRRRSQEAGSELGGASPSPYGKMSTFLPADSASLASSLGARPAVRRQKTASADDLRALRGPRPEAGSSARTALRVEGLTARTESLGLQMGGPQTQGGRRPSRTTLYY